MKSRNSMFPASPQLSARAQAEHIRSRARRILDGHGTKGNRMTLILAVVILLTVGVGSYLIAVGLYMVGYLLFGAVLWLDVVAYALMGVVGLLIVLPLAASVFRLACLAVLRADESASEDALPAVADQPELIQLFHPFTSRAAYLRCMAVGLETLVWTLLAVGLPLSGFHALAAWFNHLAHSGVAGWLCTLMTVAVVPLCLAFGILMLFLSGRRAGFSYLAMVHAELPLSEVNRYFKTLRRGFVRPFVLRMSLTGWVVLSIVTVLVPFVLHTIPYGLCCGAMYGRELKRMK